MRAGRQWLIPPPGMWSAICSAARRDAARPTLDVKRPLVNAHPKTGPKAPCFAPNTATGTDGLP